VNLYECPECGLVSKVVQFEYPISGPASDGYWMFLHTDSYEGKVEDAPPPKQWWCKSKDKPKVGKYLMAKAEKK